MFDWSIITGFNFEGSLYLLLITSAITILLSLLLVFTYERTTTPVVRSFSFVQSLVLMAIVTATIMQSIGDSLALSFGVFGALAIIRFRTVFSDMRDVAFIFAAMGVGIACGVQAYLNGAIGTIVFCLMVFALRYSQFSPKHNIKANIRFETNESAEALSSFEKVLSNYGHHITMARYRFIPETEKGASHEYEYNCIVHKLDSGNELNDDLRKLNKLKITRLVISDYSFLANN